MNRDQARELAKQLTEEIELANRKANQYIERAQGANDVLSGLLRMFPDLDEDIKDRNRTEPGVDRPRGQEAVRRIMVDAPGKWWTVKDLVRELSTRGWQPDARNPMTAVRAAAERVVTGDTAFKKSRGDRSVAATYSFHPLETGPAPKKRLAQLLEEYQPKAHPVGQIPN